MKTKAVLIILILYLASGILLLESCKKTDIAPGITPLPFVSPQGFPQPAYNFNANPSTEEGFQLGRKLFYDGRLSLDGNFPCSSCHQQVAAFTTFEHDRSHGYNHAHTLRNAPGLANLAWYKEFNQDGEAKSLAEVYEKHITNPIEMAETINHVIDKLKADTAYQGMFKAAFGKGDITSERIYRALDQFIVNLVSANSKYDKVKRGETSFTSEEQNGYIVFQEKCSTCHKEPLFTDFTYRNAGLTEDPLLKDFGRMRVTGSKADSLKFRVPSLRNVDLTSYYTHDGRMSMMRMMIEHYRHTITQSPTVDPLLTNGIQMSDQQEDELVAFLRTLSDTAFVKNPRFRD